MSLALGRTALRLGLPAYGMSSFPSRSPETCRSFGEHCVHLVEALLHAGPGEVARLLGSVAVLRDRYLCPALTRCFQTDHVGNVVRDPGGYAHRGWVEVRPVLGGEVGNELDSLVRLDPGVGPRVVHVLATVFCRGAHAHQGRTAHAEVHLGAWGGEPRRPPPPHHVGGVFPGLPDLLDGGVKDAGDDDVERFGAAACAFFGHGYISFLTSRGS